MAVRQSDPVSEIIACVSLAFRNWMLAVPCFVATLLSIMPILIFGGAGLLSMIFSGATIQDPSTLVAAIGPSLIAGLALTIIVGVVLGVIAIGATYAGADDVLNGRMIDLSAILRRGVALFGPIFVYFLIVGGVGLLVELIVGGLTALTAGLLGIILIPLAFCAFVIAAYLLMYAIPAIVVGNSSPTEAIRRSYDLARNNVGVSITIVVGLIIALICSWVVSIVLHFIPVIGAIAGLAISGIYQVFQALVISKFYLSLTGSAVPAPQPPG
jgi:hypothetical protein